MNLNNLPEEIIERKEGIGRRGKRGEGKGGHGRGA